ncbi:MAG: sulfotransferase family protein [Ignavibacteria bacterium]|nr:sulfotransferase family protein [Ignavibacteria bacterium]
MKRINLLSGPRNISTALMYSFAQRKDTIVIDEPLYARYLLLTNADHPGREEIISNMETDGKNIIREAILGEYKCDILFIKQMAHHLIDLDESFLENVINVLLIRNPSQLISSLSQVLNNIEMRDTGIKKQYDLYKKLISLDHKPIVIDSGEILKDPECSLSILCEAIGIPFDKKMLRWNAGKRKEDGIWAKYWYENVHKSTSFEKQKTSSRNLPDEYTSLYDECMVFYNEMFSHSLKVK